MKSIDERYFNDPKIASLVDMLYNAISTMELTPTEIREAAMLAQIKYEMNNPRSICLSKDLLKQLQLNKIEFK